MLLLYNNAITVPKILTIGKSTLQFKK